MTLVERLAAEAPKLSEQVLVEMYEDPFWAARFGERGKQHTRTDGDFHIKYLREALESGDRTVFEQYARWLRELLASHGMCSLHLAENFTRLAAILEREGWADADKAIEILRAGAAALAHATGDACEIEALRSKARDSHFDTLLSYLADALAFDQPERFAAYTSFALSLRPNLGAELAALRRLVALELKEPTRALAAIDLAVGSLGGSR